MQSLYNQGPDSDLGLHLGDRRSSTQRKEHGPEQQVATSVQERGTEFSREHSGAVKLPEGPDRRPKLEAHGRI